MEVSYDRAEGTISQVERELFNENNFIYGSLYIWELLIIHYIWFLLVSNNHSWILNMDFLRERFLSMNPQLSFRGSHRCFGSSLHLS